MSGRALLGLVAVAVAALAAAVAVALVSREGRSTPAALAADGIEATVSIEPRVVLFGDTIAARVEIALDRTRVDPASVRLETDFEPWTTVRTPTRAVRDAGDTRSIETAFVLRCLTDACPPRTQSAAREFGRARVAYSTVDGGRNSFTVQWPVLVVNSRIVSDDFQREDDLARPWRADLVTLPPMSYRIAPGLLAGALLAAAALLVLAAVLLARRALPARKQAVPEPEAVPVRELTPLEQALALLENGVPGDGPERRQALERVARELGGRDERLAQEASTLAWAQAAPPQERARGMARQVRALLGERDEDEERDVQA